MGALRRDGITGYAPPLRTRWTKESHRDDLRIRVPQVDSPAPVPTDEPPSPDLSDDSSDDSDSDSDSEDEDGEESEDEEEEEEEEEEDEGDEEEDEGEEEEGEDGGEDEGNADGPRPPVLTMTHAPAPSELPPPPDSAVDSQISSTTDQPSSVLPTTLVSLPSETSAPSETGVAESIAATSASSTETAVPEADTNFASDESNSGTSNRGADVGIILGTLGLAALLVLGSIFLYRWSLKRKEQSAGSTVFGDRSSLGDSDHTGLVGAAAQMQEQPGQRGLYHGSWAVFNPHAPAQEPTNAASGAASGSMDPRAVAMAALTGGAVSPVGPPPPAATYQPYRETDNNGVSPPDSPVFPTAPGLSSHPTVPAVQVTRASSSAQPLQSLGLPYPPGTFRLSVARTETTDQTEGTWRTWGVDQSRPTHEKGWKERYLT